MGHGWIVYSTHGTCVCVFTHTNTLFGQFIFLKGGPFCNLHKGTGCTALVALFLQPNVSHDTLSIAHFSDSSSQNYNSFLGIVFIVRTILNLLLSPRRIASPPTPPPSRQEPARMFALSTLKCKKFTPKFTSSVGKIFMKL